MFQFKKKKPLISLAALILVVGLNYFAVLVSTTVVAVAQSVVVTAAQVSTHTTATESVAGAGVVSGVALSQAVKTKANNAITTKVKIDFFILQIYSIKNTKAKS